MLSAYMAMIDSKAVRKEFERFYYENRLLGMNIAYGLTRNVAMSEDALSESFFRLAKNFQKVHNFPSHKLRAYFVIIVRNVSVELLRRENRTEAVPYNDELAHAAGEDDFPDCDDSRLAECLDKLGDTDREILYLRFELGLEYGEIAHTLGISDQAARQRVRHARNRLGELLEGE